PGWSSARAFRAAVRPHPALAISKVPAIRWSRGRAGWRCASMPACDEPLARAGLEVQGLHCERGGRVLFAALDIALPCGSALSVTGPNGSGKTTLLRALAGFTEAEAERVTWKNEPVALGSAAWRTQLAYVGHRPGHKDELTATENL